MRKIIFLPLLFLAFIVKGQTIDDQVKKISSDISNQVADKKIEAFASTLPVTEIIVFKTNSNVSMPIDTILLENNKDTMLLLSLRIKNLNNNEIGDALRVLHVKNDNGTYKIYRDYNIFTYGGETSVSSTRVSWSIGIVNKLVVIRFVGANNVPIEGKLTKNPI